MAQYNAESDLQAIVGSAYISLLNGGIQSYGSNMQQIAKGTVNRMVFRDSPRLNQTLTSTNLIASFQEIIRQLKEDGDTVLAMTVAAAPTLFTAVSTNIGNGCIIASVRRPFDGAVLENSFAETLLFTCNNDSYSGGSQAGNEGFALTGTGQQTNLFAFDWPLGSNCSIGLNAINGASDNTSGNLLTNSGFDAWTGGAPDNWEVVGGGSMISEETTIVFGSGSSLALTGDGTTNFQIRQVMDDSDGTLGAVEQQTQYAINLWLRRDGIAASNGTLTVDLTDSANNVLLDVAGNPCTFNIDLTALTTSFQNFGSAFRTPIVLPTAGPYVRYRLTGTALTSGRKVYIDRTAMGQMRQAYVGGPFAAVFSGSTNFVQGDYATAAVTNSRGAAGTLSTFQTLWYQLMSPEWGSNEFLLPSSATPSISDSLIG